MPVACQCRRLIRINRPISVPITPQRGRIWPICCGHEPFGRHRLGEPSSVARQLSPSALERPMQGEGRARPAGAGTRPPPPSLVRGEDVAVLADDPTGGFGGCSSAALGVARCGSRARGPKPRLPISITGQPSNPSDVATAGFTWSTVVANYTCALDNGAATSCTSPKSYSGLADGTHKFVVTGKKNGSFLPGSASVTWTVAGRRVPR